MVARLGRMWDVLAAAICAVAAAMFVPATAIDRIATELVSFFGVQAAVILPAMIFTAGILRPEGLSLPEARRYRLALRRQMLFWVVLLALDFLTVGMLILGRATEWSLVLTFPWGWIVDLTTGVVGIAVLLGTLAVLRIIPFIQGVLSLQSVNADLTEKAIQARDTASEEKDAVVAKPFEKPEGYGDIVRPH